ncbi:MAG TPA: polysaccharide biosynthesis/export family protein [Terriglobales bacterium]|nr:polysaccharide biosynthesis/export family protein [Terriglobales bacterium]
MNLVRRPRLMVLAASAALCVSLWGQDYSAANKLEINSSITAKEPAQPAQKEQPQSEQASKEPVLGVQTGGEPKAVHDVPAPEQEYLVGEGDLLHINVWKEPEISQSVTVRPDGNISLPLIDEFRVAGLSPRAIQQLVTDKLKSVLTNPQVTVTVAEVRSKMVYVTGEVGKPGAYSVVAPMNVLQLIARAGGLTQFANRKQIYILRSSSQDNRLKFNYSEVVKGHNPDQNVILHSGDTVVVP